MGTLSVEQVEPSAVISGLNGLIVLVSAVGATALHFLRLNNGRRGMPAQWFGDALNIGTLIVLLWIAAGRFFPQLGADRLASENSVLITLAFAYCALMIGYQLVESIKKEG